MDEEAKRPEVTPERAIEMLVVEAFPVRSDGTIEDGVGNGITLRMQSDGHDAMFILLKSPRGALKKLYKEGLSDEEIKAALARHQAREDMLPKFRLVKKPSGRPISGWQQVVPLGTPDLSHTHASVVDLSDRRGTHTGYPARF